MLTLAPLLVHPPDVLIADEPTLGLAPLVVAELMGIFRELRDRGVAPELAGRATQAAVPPEEQAERCRRVATARLAHLHGLRPEVRLRRLAGYLERRGYPAEVIGPVLADLIPRRD
jgi:SOS response regulatory protein OraA/RecX